MAGVTGQDDQIIELTEVVDDEAEMADVPSNDDIADDSLIELTDVEELVDAEADEVPAGGMAGDIPYREVSVSREQLEAALERVIEKKFADKIEPLLFDTMERVLLKEIKQTLLKDLDRIGPF